MSAGDKTLGKCRMSKKEIERIILGNCRLANFNAQQTIISKPCNWREHWFLVGIFLCVWTNMLELFRNDPKKPEKSKFDNALYGFYSNILWAQGKWCLKSRVILLQSQEASNTMSWIEKRLPCKFVTPPLHYETSYPFSKRHSLSCIDQRLLIFCDNKCRWMKYVLPGLWQVEFCRRWAVVSRPPTPRNWRWW